jgi:hypothetical protein
VSEIDLPLSKRVEFDSVDSIQRWPDRKRKDLYEQEFRDLYAHLVTHRSNDSKYGCHASEGGLASLGANRRCRRSIFPSHHNLVWEFCDASAASGAAAAIRELIRLNAPLIQRQ